MTVLSAAAERFLAGPLLAEVDDHARIALFHALEEERADAGTDLIEGGRPNPKLWFLLDGTATIVRKGIGPGGGDEVIGRIEAPGIFGATTFFRPGPATATIRASSDVSLLSLDHPGHARLRRDDPRAAEALALAATRALAERFDLLDVRLSEYIAAHQDDRKATEWAAFRTRLFEEPTMI